MNQNDIFLIIYTGVHQKEFKTELVARRADFSLFLIRVLRDNPLVCSCDLHWLQEWQRNERGDLDNQMLFCFSRDKKVSLNSLVIDNCSELAFILISEFHFAMYYDVIYY